MLPLLNAFVLLLDAVEDLFWLETKEKEEHGDKRAALLGEATTFITPNKHVFLGSTCC